jgi:hypothetical protein
MSANRKKRIESINDDQLTIGINDDQLTIGQSQDREGGRVQHCQIVGGKQRIHNAMHTFFYLGQFWMSTWSVQFQINL